MLVIFLLLFCVCVAAMRRCIACFCCYKSSHSFKRLPTTANTEAVANTIMTTVTLTEPLAVVHTASFLRTLPD